MSRRWLIVVRHGRTEANAAPPAAGPARPAARRAGPGPGRGAGRRGGPGRPGGDQPAAAHPPDGGRLRRARRRSTSASSSSTTATTTGMPLADVPGRAVAAVAGATPTSRRPAASRWPRCADRVEAALDDLAEPAGRETIVVVAHVSPIKAAVTWALGVGDEVTWRLFVQPGVDHPHRRRRRGPILHSFNEVAHLGRRWSMPDEPPRPAERPARPVGCRGDGGAAAGAPVGSYGARRGPYVPAVRGHRGGWVGLDASRAFPPTPVVCATAPGGPALSEMSRPAHAERVGRPSPPGPSQSP